MSRVRLVLIEAEGDDKTISAAMQQIAKLLEESKSPSGQRIEEYTITGDHFERPGFDPNAV